jgi:hypothetical protein
MSKKVVKFQPSEERDGCVHGQRSQLLCLECMKHRALLAEQKLSTYADCFEQLGVKSLAELVEKYDKQIEKLGWQNEAQRNQLEEAPRDDR